MFWRICIFSRLMTGIWALIENTVRKIGGIVSNENAFIFTTILRLYIMILWSGIMNKWSQHLQDKQVWRLEPVTIVGSCVIPMIVVTSDGDDAIACVIICLTTWQNSILCSLNLLVIDNSIYLYSAQTFSGWSINSERQGLWTSKIKAGGLRHMHWIEGYHDSVFWNRVMMARLQLQHLCKGSDDYDLFYLWWL